MAAWNGGRTPGYGHAREGPVAPVAPRPPRKEGLPQAKKETNCKQEKKHMNEKVRL